MPPPTLISEEYLAQQKWLHDQPRGYGGGGWKFSSAALEILKDFPHLETVLDYGSGQGSFAKAMMDRAGIHVSQYDPAIPDHAALPEPADLVVSTDVLEHIEPDCLDAVLAHMASVTRFYLFAVIALEPANKTLPDGRNAHLILESPQWWMHKLERHFEIAVEYRPERKWIGFLLKTKGTFHE